MPTPVVEVEDITIQNHSSRVIPTWVKGRPPYGAGANPKRLLFSGVMPGETETKNIRISNVGFYKLVLNEVTLQESEDYSWTGTVPEFLPIGGYFDLAVTFTPHEEGGTNSLLTINLGHGLQPLLVPLIGISGWNYVSIIDEMLEGLWEFIQRATLPALSADGPVASLSGSSVVFAGTTEVEKHSTTMTVTITNSGNQNLIIDSITVSGDFEVIE